MDVKQAGESLLGNEFVKTAQEKSALGKDDFMKLLLAQLENQDPMAPNDSKEFMAQLAQLSSLEQLQNINDNISTQSIVQTAGTNSQTVSYIGKTVTASGDTVSVNENGVATAQMEYALAENSQSVDVTITDENGNIVKVIKAGSKSAGKHEVNWDGCDEDGNPVPPGKYTFDVGAVNQEGGKVESQYYIKGQVTGITYENGYPELIVGGNRIMLGDIVSVDGEESFSENSEKPASKSAVENLKTIYAQNNNLYDIK